MKEKVFFINFQGLSVVKSCLIPETTPFAILTIKGGLLCNFTKTLKGHHFMGHSGTSLKLSVTIDL